MIKELIPALLLGSAVMAAAPGVQTEPVAAPAAASAACPEAFFNDTTAPAWSRMTPQAMVRAAEAACREAEAGLQSILRLQPGETNFDNTFGAYYRAERKVRQLHYYMYHLSHVAETPEFREARARVTWLVTGYEQKDNLYGRVWQVLSTAAQADWVAGCTPAQQRLVHKTCTDFRAAGAHLTPDQQAKKTLLEQQLSLLYMQFNQNIRPELRRWSLLITDPAELKGLPERWLQTAAALARREGQATAEKPGWLVTASLAPAVMSLCEVEETRRKCWPGTQVAAAGSPQDNEPVIARIMELRQQLAGLCGYKNYADMQAATRMLSTGEEALAFVDGLLQGLKPAHDALVAEELKNYSAAAGRELNAVEPWNLAYYKARAARPKEFFNASVLTPYLQTERVLSSLMKHWGNMLGVTITEQATACPAPGQPCPDGKVEVWHPSVRAWQVCDTASGEHIGSFYMDLYPRRGKRAQGAWCQPLGFGAPGADGQAATPNRVALCANFAPAFPGEVHLLNANELCILFHEFGHLMHMVLCRSELQPLNPTAMERDFIEMPSLLSEQWVWEPEFIREYAAHWQTGEPMPEALVAQFVRSHAGASVTRHIEMLATAKLDLEMHMHYAEKFRGKPLDAATAELLAPWQFPLTMPGSSAMRTLAHSINGGYAAGYYIYKWSEVLAADVFDRFRREGVCNPAVGASYRQSILAPGSSGSATDLLRNFTGHAPSPAAFLRRMNIPQQD